jgi:hypothetical protein
MQSSWRGKCWQVVWALLVVGMWIGLVMMWKSYSDNGQTWQKNLGFVRCEIKYKEKTSCSVDLQCPCGTVRNYVLTDATCTRKPLSTEVFMDKQQCDVLESNFLYAIWEVAAWCAALVYTVLCLWYLFSGTMSICSALDSFFRRRREQQRLVPCNVVSDL